MHNPQTNPHFDSSRPAPATIRGGNRVLCGEDAAAWGAFHDVLDQFLVEMRDGEHLDLSTAEAAWTIRVTAGWAGIDGPGTVAHHLQLAGRRSGATGELAEWSTTPYARGLGFGATRVAADLAAMGLGHSEPHGPNPSILNSGADGALEMADMAVEMLREVFAVGSPAKVSMVANDDWPIQVGGCDCGAEVPMDVVVQQIAHAGAELVTDDDTVPMVGHDGATTDLLGIDHISTMAAVAARTDEPWWDSVGFTGAPTVVGEGHVVGSVGDVLVEIERDGESLAGLDVVVVRARITEPEAAPRRVPAGKGFSMLRSIQAPDRPRAHDIAIEPVRGTGHVVHAWAHRMVVLDTATTDVAVADAQMALDAAVADMVAYVSDLRWADPEASRPLLMVFRPAV